MVRVRVGLVVFLAASVSVAACGDDDVGGREAADVTSTTAHDPRVEDAEAGDRRWSDGSATVEVDGQSFEFALDFCATQPVDPAPETTTVTLQVDGTTPDGDPAELRIVETVTSDVRIQVVTVRFVDGAGDLSHSWEAQRVVDLATGDVDDLHGDGATPLLDVDEGDELVVTAQDAAFWQFGMATAEDRPAGSGSVRATCSGS